MIARIEGTKIRDKKTGSPEFRKTQKKPDVPFDDYLRKEAKKGRPIS
jgi:hypothetical protein